MSVTLEILLARYGNKLLMTVEDMSNILGVSQITIRNQLCEERFPIPTFKQGSRRVAHVHDVADYIDSLKAPQKRRGPKTKAERIAAAAQQAGGAA